ncbi:M64 family metallopeptidase [Catellatospora tritici]|uniref:M64 family metallopeptidase n=1 Tax=Catellatospora tritici TaxID=2851566 RepID=UPI001C2D9348|nr:M64 family metallopeptidase [Catellatospora tritici]MBV1850568.1 M64 family metallopeptidase [Catellatospora tritici]
MSRTLDRSGSGRRRKVTALLALLGLVLPTQSVSAPMAWAGHTVKLRVVIEKVVQKGCTDSTDGSDFYARITINGKDFDFGEITDQDEISPTDWKAEWDIPVDVQPTGTVQILVAESDGGLNFGDDVCDISPADGTDLDLTVPLIPCSVTGEATTACGQTKTVRGNDDGEGDGDASISFRVEVDVPDAPGLAVRCTHSPLWPQPGDDVTITVESFDGAMQVGDMDPDAGAPRVVDRRKIADKLEIWVQDQPGPTPDAPDLVLSNRTLGDIVVHDVPAGDLEYGCVVRKGADNRFTGWRKTRVGAPAQSATDPAVPVIFTGARANSIDVVLIADTDNYSGPKDPAFLSAAAGVVKGAYFGQNYFLNQQQHLNFWIADQRGDADPGGGTGGPICVLTRPSNWATRYATWADAGGILHTDNFRDCANNGLFSTEPTFLSTVLHETGHAAFGLADEYCRESGNICDGGYFENRPFPNLFDTLAECQAEAPNAAACRSFTDINSRTWSLSDPSPNDLMNVDQRPPQGADIARMDWKFNNCITGLC